MISKPIAPTGPGVIRADECYSLAEFQLRTKLGRHALRSLRRAGLAVRTIGGRRFILGADFLQIVQQTISKESV